MNEDAIGDIALPPQGENKMLLNAMDETLARSSPLTAKLFRGEWLVVDRFSGKEICSCGFRDGSEANARRIVTAANAHGDLLVALKDARKCLTGNYPGAVRQDVVTGIDAAIAKAGGSS